MDGATYLNRSHEVLARLAESQIRLKEAEARTQEQFLETDRRIECLVHEIRELISRRSPAPIDRQQTPP